MLHTSYIIHVKARHGRCITTVTPAETARLYDCTEYIQSLNGRLACCRMGERMVDQQGQICSMMHAQHPNPLCIPRFPRLAHAPSGTVGRTEGLAKAFLLVWKHPGISGQPGSERVAWLMPHPATRAMRRQRCRIGSSVCPVTATKALSPKEAYRVIPSADHLPSAAVASQPHTRLGLGPTATAPGSRGWRDSAGNIRFNCQLAGNLCLA